MKGSGFVIGDFLIVFKSGGGPYASDSFSLYRRIIPCIYIRTKTRQEHITDAWRMAWCSALFVVAFWVLGVLPHLITWRGAAVWLLVWVMGKVQNARVPS